MPNPHGFPPGLAGQLDDGTDNNPHDTVQVIVPPAAPGPAPTTQSGIPSGDGFNTLLADGPPGLLAHFERGNWAPEVLSGSNFDVGFLAGPAVLFADLASADITGPLVLAGPDIAGFVNNSAAPLVVDDSAQGFQYIVSGSAGMTLNVSAADGSFFAAGGDNLITTANSGMGSWSFDLNGGRNTVVSGDGNNIIETSGGQNTIVLGAGDDTVSVQGRDTIFAGTGADDIYTKGNNTIVLGGGNDTVISAGSDVIFTGTGSSLLVSNGNDTIVASAGNDTIFSHGSDLVFAGSGDSLIVSTGVDTIVAGSGDDTVSVDGDHSLIFGGKGTMTFIDANGTANPGAATIVGGSGSMVVEGNNSSVTVWGGAGGGLFFGGAAGNNLLVAGLGAATLVGGGSGDSLYGGQSGHDVLVASSGNETLLGSNTAGGNVFYGGSGDDVIVTGAGNNTVYGGSAGNDSIFEGAGTTQIIGGVANMYIQAGTGNASILAGTGKEVFDFVNGAAGGSTVIDGFNLNQDTIELTGYASGTASSVFANAAVSGGSTLFTLPDKTQITLSGITGLSHSPLIS